MLLEIWNGLRNSMSMNCTSKPLWKQNSRSQLTMFATSPLHTDTLLDYWWTNVPAQLLHPCAVLNLSIRTTHTTDYQHSWLSSCHSMHVAQRLHQYTISFTGTPTFLRNCRSNPFQHHSLAWPSSISYLQNTDPWWTVDWPAATMARPPNTRCLLPQPLCCYYFVIYPYAVFNAKNISSSWLVYLR